MLSALTAYQWFSVAAAVGQLALAVVALLRRSTSPLALPFGALCVSLFGWNLSGLGHALTNESGFRYLDLALSPISLATALHFVLAFVGRARRLRWVLGAGYVVFGLLSATSLLALGLPIARQAVASPVWAATFLAAIGAVLATTVPVLVMHFRRSAGRQERFRCSLVLAAIVVGFPLGATELLNNFGVPVPGLGNIATLFVAVVFGIVTFRLRLLGRESGLTAPAAALVAAAVAVILYIAIFSLLGESVLAVALGTIIVTLLLGFVLERIFHRRQERRRRQARLTWLGRMSDQLAHDLKNPLAAILGAVQFLQEEQRRGRSIDPQAELVDLIGEQAQRMIRVSDKYRHMASVDPDYQLSDLNDLVSRTVEVMRHGPLAHVEVLTELAADLPAFSMDPDLLTAALENMLSNAAEASPEGARVWVGTAREAGLGVLSVRDEGRGMDPRTLERVFDDFFTTRTSGGGLGLAFVKRVIEAHGGKVSATSQAGSGTELRCRLPMDQDKA